MFFSIEKEVDSIVNDDYEKVILIKRVETETNTIAKSIRNMVLSDNDQEISTEINEISTAKNEINYSLNSLESIVLREQGLRQLQDLKEWNSTYHSLVQEEIDLVLAGERDMAVELLLTQGKSVQDELFQQIDEMVAYYEIQMDSSVDQIHDLFRTNSLAMIILSALAMIIGSGIVYWLIRDITRGLSKVSTIMASFSKGDTDSKTRIPIKSNDEIGELSKSFNAMAQTIEEQNKREQESNQELQNQHWLSSNLAEITNKLHLAQNLQEFADTFMTQVTPVANGQHGAFYLHDQEKDVYLLSGTYAFTERKLVNNQIKIGEGMVGQSALENKPILLTQVPNDHIQIQTGLGVSAPLNVMVVPIVYKNIALAVFEIASYTSFSDIQQKLLIELGKSLGIMLENMNGKIRTEKLLEESNQLTEELQVQSEELLTQQDELKRVNEELETQAQNLRDSEEKLQLQQEELEQTNVELEEKAKQLEERNKNYEQKNMEVVQSKEELEEKAKQLILISKYKSEFLANMSHELRTPLNSILILAKMLKDNKQANLSEKQVEFAETIYSCGNDLLTLINEILDLSKVESGMMEVSPAAVSVDNITNYVKSVFDPLAKEKRITFTINSNSNVPKTIITDEKRLQQILKNLLSNAFKFTAEGEVTLQLEKAKDVNIPDNAFFEKDLNPTDDMIAISVIDTGIGVPKDKQQIIFEAFQQVDGSTSRKYGGSGLGLSISRELASLLGGFIQINSTEREGSTFTLYLPVTYTKNSESPVMTTVSDQLESAREEVAAMLTEHPSQRSNKGKTEPETQSPFRHLLLVEDNEIQRDSLSELLEDDRTVVTAVSSGNDAIEKLKENTYDCLILDLGLEDMPGFELLKVIKQNMALAELPIFIYTGKKLTSKEEYQLKKYAKTTILKDSYSPERLLEELYILFNRSGDLLQRESSITQQYQTNQTSILKGKKVLLVDDDIRNVFALSSAMESHDMEVIYAENGKECLESLEANSNPDLILMDVMMPEMDGYQTIQHIRQSEKFRHLPIISLTAKAMKDDREKCIQAGASDYITKPVNVDQLISLIKVWLHE